MRNSANSRAYRLAVLSRAAAAAFGGYAAAAALSIMLSHVLPLPRAEAVLTAMLLSFALYAAVVVWAFAARNPGTVWLVLLGAAGSCAGVSWLLGAGSVI
ncbi:MAG: iron transporter [Alphaproteobacteria bacterium]|nr:iron transporter [Alphaproteobacteria bacterium]